MSGFGFGFAFGARTGVSGLLARYGFDELFDAGKRTDVAAGDLTTWTGENGTVATGSTAKPNLLANTPKIKAGKAIQFVSADSEFLQADGLASILTGATEATILIVAWIQPNGTTTTLIDYDALDLNLSVSSADRLTCYVGGAANAVYGPATISSGLYCIELRFDGAGATNQDKVKVNIWGVDHLNGDTGTIPASLPSLSACRICGRTDAIREIDSEIVLLGVKLGLLSSAQSTALAAEMAALYDPTFEATYNPDVSLWASAGVFRAAAGVTQWDDSAGSADVTAPGGAEPGYTLVDAAYGGQPSVTFDGTQWCDADAIAAIVSGQTAVTLAWCGSVSAANQIVFSANNIAFALYRLGATNFRLYFGGSNYASITAPTDGVVATHVITFSAGAVRWWVDGVEQSVSVTGTIPGAVPTVASGGVGSSSSLGSAPQIGGTYRLLVWTSDQSASAAAISATIQAEIT